MSKTLVDGETFRPGGLRTTAGSGGGLNNNEVGTEYAHPFGLTCPDADVEEVASPFGGGRPTALPKVSAAFMQGDPESELRITEITEILPPKPDPLTEPPKISQETPDDKPKPADGVRISVRDDGGLFQFTNISTDDIKAKIKFQLRKPDPYDVKNFYHASGYWQALAKHPIFENVTLFVIALNAVWMAVDTDFNGADSLMEAHPFFIVGENFFAVYFSFEWLTRFMAFKHKCDGRKDGWFVFDSILVFMMVFETWVVLMLGDLLAQMPSGGILRLFRLLRLSRLMRMLRSLPELMILIKGMMSAMRSVLYVMALLILITYVFAIACTQLSAGYEFGEAYFQTVGLSMYSLIIYGTFLDALSDFCDAIKAESPMVLGIIMIFVCLSALTVMNMLIGVLCEVISQVAATEKEDLLTTSVRETFEQVLEALDQNGDKRISMAEYQNMMDIPEVLSALEQVGVDPVGMADFAETFFFDENKQPIEISFERFMELIYDLRESKFSTVKDLLSFKSELNIEMKAGQKQVLDLTRDVTELRGKTDNIEKQLEAILGLLGGANSRSLS